MEPKQLAFRSYSNRRGRAVKPCIRPLIRNFDHGKVISKDLSLPSIDNSICGFSPDPSRAKTPSTKSNSSTGSQPPNLRIGTAPLLIDLPNVSAKSWAICSGDTGELMWGVNQRDRREIASLTKIMTCYLSIRLVKKLPGVNFQSIVKVSKVAAMMTGTSAELQEGDELTVWDLLHGLMLPSGNDAAWCLSEYFGKHLQSLLESESPSKNYTRYFVSEMNSLAKKMKLRMTSFDNPHGLADPTNRSTAKDLGRLAARCMHNSRFRELVRTKLHSCIIYQPEACQSRRVRWVNTNKLLDAGWVGVKTGVTQSAGPCLSACYRAKSGVSLIITLLNCKNLEKRWSEAVTLANWAMEKLDYIA